MVAPIFFRRAGNREHKPGHILWFLVVWFSKKMGANIYTLFRGWAASFFRFSLKLPTIWLHTNLFQQLVDTNVFHFIMLHNLVLRKANLVQSAVLLMYYIWSQRASVFFSKSLFQIQINSRPGAALQTLHCGD